MMDPYESFAERYDLFHGQFGAHDPEVVAFFRKLFAQNGVRSVLDCACGTGQHLPLFHALGCEVIGSDVSAAMLAQARKNLATYGAEVPLHQADYRYLPQHFERRFDALMCLSSSILHMPDETEAKRAFRSMRAVLREGGILVLSQGTTDRQWREKPRFILVSTTKEHSRLFVIDYLGQGARYNVLDIPHTEDVRDFQVWSVEYPRIWLRDEQERLLRRSGFVAVDFYGTYRLEPYDKETSGQLIAVARR
ncbi:class I SAM-dependent methyltransferase [Chloroflexota bacterium]